MLMMLDQGTEYETGEGEFVDFGVTSDLGFNTLARVLEPWEMDLMYCWSSS